MPMQRNRLTVLKTSTICALLLTVANHAAATTITHTFSGNFTNDDELAWFDFNLQQNGSIAARTTSFGNGGFAPVLSLFSLLANQDLLHVAQGSSNTCATSGAGQASSGLCWDAVFSTGLSAGNYRLVISQDGNTPNGPALLDGFNQTGNPHYTGINYLGDASRSFINYDGMQRSNAYAGNFQLTSAVPEPESVVLLLAGLAAIAGLSRSRRTK